MNNEQIKHAHERLSACPRDIRLPNACLVSIPDFHVMDGRTPSDTILTEQKLHVNLKFSDNSSRTEHGIRPGFCHFPQHPLTP